MHKIKAYKLVILTMAIVVLCSACCTSDCPPPPRLPDFDVCIHYPKSPLPIPTEVDGTERDHSQALPGACTN
jgi:hypothetical protein